MSKNVYALGGVFGLAALLSGLGYLSHIGVFSSVQVRTQRTEPMLLVYKVQKGGFRDTGRAVGEIVRNLQNVGIYDVKGFSFREAGDDRIQAGVILPKRHTIRAAGVLNHYQTRIFSPREGVTASFPLRNTFSMRIGEYKVWPKIEEAFKARGLALQEFLEIYDFGNEIVYFAPTNEEDA